MLGTGVRIGEAAAVRAAVLDLDDGTVLINAIAVRARPGACAIRPILRPTCEPLWTASATPG